jgi:hypothetical protein
MGLSLIRISRTASRINIISAGGRRLMGLDLEPCIPITADDTDLPSVTSGRCSAKTNFRRLRNSGATRSNRPRLFASVCEPRPFAPFLVATGARRSQRIGGLNHLVLVLGLGRPVSLHSCIPKLLDKFRPVRIIHRNGQAIRALSSGDQQ